MFERFCEILVCSYHVWMFSHHVWRFVQCLICSGNFRMVVNCSTVRLMSDWSFDVWMFVKYVIACTMSEYICICTCSVRIFLQPLNVGAISHSSFTVLVFEQYLNVRALSEFTFETLHSCQVRILVQSLIVRALAEWSCFVWILLKGCLFLYWMNIHEMSECSCNAWMFN